ncbi:hypothetical protein AVEN_215460-1 [Araneus ventricosus]|uniref:Uncharacterized protein n=1 Tax=Araneus ventricosus TaxID=182803 RepID=A0A4Y2MNZ3_ARAVE|nr:hypothetical protein AVEN_215460-1 [Araneus ventricosus]
MAKSEVYSTALKMHDGDGKSSSEIQTISATVTTWFSILRYRNPRRCLNASRATNFSAATLKCLLAIRMLIKDPPGMQGRLSQGPMAAEEAFRVHRSQAAGQRLLLGSDAIQTPAGRGRCFHEMLGLDDVRVN